jgi:hypothetical protein
MANLTVSKDSTSPFGLDLAQTILKGLRSPNFLPTIYTTLFNSGVTEGAFHSYMVSALLILGNLLGYSAVCDSPVFDRLDNLLTGECSKRPDSVWFKRGTETIQTLFEFERYQPNALEQKARNLTFMANSITSSIKLLCLIYWTWEVLDHSLLKGTIDVFRKGFKIRNSSFGPISCPVLILEVKTKSVNGEKVLIDGFIVRGFVHGGENKQYIVEKLNS